MARISHERHVLARVSVGIDFAAVNNNQLLCNAICRDTPKDARTDPIYLDFAVFARTPVSHLPKHTPLGPRLFAISRP
jgi:hypothetical protein